MLQVNIMMCLGVFPFTLSTLAYQQLERTTAQRFAQQNVIGRRARQQHLGPGDDDITLSGTLLPRFKGTTLSLDLLREMQATGKPWVMVCGYGRVFGSWLILSVREAQTAHRANGAADRIDFTLTLRRTDADLIDALASLKTSTTALLGAG